MQHKAGYNPFLRTLKPWHYRFTWPLLLLVLGIYNCGEPSVVGTDLFPDESFDLELIDTLSLTVYTYGFDSLQTSGFESLLVGHHQDNTLGTVTATSYLQLGSPETTSLDEEQTRYDSLTLEYTLNGYSFYDTLTPIGISVHRLVENLEGEEIDQFYNTSKFAYDPIPLGEKRFVPRPGRKEENSIRLSDALGKELFQLIQEEDEALLTTSSFLDFFKGIALVPDSTTSGSILGLTKEIRFILHYTDQSRLPTEQKTVVFPMTGLENFHNIQIDRQGTSLAGLSSDQNQIQSKLTQEESYIQGGAGLVTRIEIPHIRQLLADFGELIITSASLRIFPVTDVQERNTPLPFTLAMFPVDENDFPALPGRTARLVEDREFGRDTYYDFDVTDFIQQQLAIEAFNSNNLLVQLPDELFATQVTRVSIGDGNHGKKMELQLYVLRIKN